MPVTVLPFTARLTGYTRAPTIMEGGAQDCRGNALHTLQEFLRGRAPFVSIAMDRGLPFPYGSRVRILSLDEFYATRIDFRLVDTGRHFDGLSLTGLDICHDDDAHANAVEHNIPAFCALLL